MRGPHRLVVCFDGTWNNADTSGEEATNVERIARAVKGDSGTTPQVTLYLRGVGSTGHRLQQIVDGATGNGVDDNIRSAYQFLAQNYLPARFDDEGNRIEADEIFLFGFSRGAFSARSLAGFISSSGLLKRQQLHRLGDAWDYYRREGERTPQSFCDIYDADCHKDITIQFVGVWDTVGALGIPTSVVNLPLLNAEHQFHDTTPSRIVKHAYHAVAIDEHRDEFVPTLWTGEVPDGAVIEQVWFAGAHSDIGGGYRHRALANVPLHWMAEKAKCCGLELDWHLLNQDVPDATGPQHESRVSFGWKDRVTPTIRQIKRASFKTSFLEEAYWPKDKSGNRLKPINECIHPKALERWGRTVELILDEDPLKQGDIVYEPKNLGAARAMV